MKNTTETGREFENEVANLYRILGYGVETNVDFHGFQIDLIVSRHIPGADETKLIIECKFKSRGNVSNVDVAIVPSSGDVSGTIRSIIRNPIASANSTPIAMLIFRPVIGLFEPPPASVSRRSPSGVSS